MHNTRLATFFLALLAALSAAKPSAADAPVRIKLGVLPSALSAPAYIAEADGLFTKAGLDVQVVQMSNGVAALQAIQAGDLDGTVSASAPFVISTSRGVAIQNVYTFVQYSRQVSPEAVIVRADSSIKTLADLRGKKVAVDSYGDLEDARLQADVLPTLGMTRKDVELVEIPWHAMEGALAHGQVDAVIPFDPTTARLRSNPQFRVVSDLRSYLPASSYPLDTIVLSDKFITAHPEAVSKLVRALSDGVKAVLSDRKRAVAMTAKAMNANPSLVADTLNDVQYLEARPHPLAAYRAFVATLEKVHQLAPGYDVTKYLREP